MSHPAFEPDWLDGNFVTRGECENPECKQVFYGVGAFTTRESKLPGLSWEEYYDQPPAYSSYYKLAQLHPPLMLMSIPKSAPEPVREGVERASRVLFTDPGLAATALRSTVERFLTASGVPQLSSEGKFRSLDRRIEEWRGAGSDRVQISKLLKAVKWLGNAGTHEDSVLTVLDVLGGAELLDEAFHRLFHGPDIDAAAHSINAAKGPTRTPIIPQRP